MSEIKLAVISKCRSRHIPDRNDMLVRESLLMASQSRVVNAASTSALVGELSSTSRLIKLVICRNGAKLLTPLSPYRLIDWS